MILVDTSVLLDVLTDDAVWAGWSERQLDAAGLQGSVVINEIVYAELSVRAPSMEDVDFALQGLRIEVPDHLTPCALSRGQGLRSLPCAGRHPVRCAA